MPDVLNHPFDDIKLTICGTHNPDCLNRIREQCSTEQVKDLLRTCSTEREDDFLMSQNIGAISHARWWSIQTSEKKRYWDHSASDELISILGMRPKHVCNARTRASGFKAAKASLKEHKALVVVDFAKNFTCRELVETKSTYWNRNNATIHPVVAMFNKNKALFGNELTTINLPYLHCCVTSILDSKKCSLPAASALNNSPSIQNFNFLIQ